MSETTAFDGNRVLLTNERWRQLVVRHSELENRIGRIMEAVSNPDEVYLDSRGATHALKRLVHGVSDYLVVVYRKDNEEGYIRTAYYMSSERKVRRYRRFRRLRPS